MSTLALKYQNFKAMKNIILLSICIALVSFGSIQAQKEGESIPYKILVNDPTIVPTNYVDLYYFDYEAAMVNQLNWQKKFDGLGSTVMAEIGVANAVGVQARASVYYLGERTEQMKLPFHVEAGGYFKVKEMVKKQKIKVPLRTFKTRVRIEDRDGNYLGSGKALAYNFIEVMANKQFDVRGRAGAMFRRQTYAPVVEGTSYMGSQSVMGIYIGGEVTRRAHVETQVFDSVITSAEYFKSYADVVIFPVATVSTPAQNRRRLIGFRFGATGKLPGMKNIMNWMFPKVEFGKLPLDGWYWNVGFGMNLYKS